MAYRPLSVGSGRPTLMMADRRQQKYHDESKCSSQRYFESLQSYKYLENRKEAKRMNYLCKAGTYLNSVASTVDSLCGMVMSDELYNNVESQYKIAITLIELEQATADFIDGMEIDSELPQEVSISKRKLIGINGRLIKHLEKIQLQGYNMEQLITTLKLENETLNKELDFA